MLIRLFQRLLLFSGLQKKRLIRSFLAYLVSSFFEMIPIMAILTVLTGILKQLSGDVMPESTIWISLGIMIVSIVGRIVFVNLSAKARTLGSFAFGSEKRMEIGERLKRAPMGYFNENRLGDITAAVTTTLGDLEQQSAVGIEAFVHQLCNVAENIIPRRIYQYVFVQNKIPTHASDSEFFERPSPSHRKRYRFQ